MSAAHVSAQELSVPSPPSKTSEDLVEAIRNIDSVSAEYKEKYERFVKDFCEPSDGRAAARVVDRMLEMAAGDLVGE